MTPALEYHQVLGEPVSLNGWWVVAAVVLIASPWLAWTAVFELFPAWLRNTTLSAALMLWLGLIVFGLVCSFFDARESIAQGAREIEL